MQWLFRSGVPAPQVRRSSGADIVVDRVDGPTLLEGDSVLHPDFYPMNVMISAQGPVIIDWSNVSRGGASFDGAISVVIMSSFEACSPRDQLARRFERDARGAHLAPASRPAVMAASTFKRPASRAGLVAATTPSKQPNMAIARPGRSRPAADLWMECSFCLRWQLTGGAVG